MTIQAQLENDRSQVISRYESGESTNSLAKYYNCNSGTIYYFLQKQNVEIRKRKKFEGKIEDYDDQIKDLVDEGKGHRFISNKLGISPTIILKRMRTLGIYVVKQKPLDPNNLLKDKKELITKLHYDNLSSSEIAKMTGHSQSAIHVFITKLGLEKREWKYSVDETFFKKINTEYKAYILGWMYSDGNVMDSGKWRIEIHNKDVEILRQIKDIVRYEGPITYQDDMCSLCVNRKSMQEDLKKLGCVPKKSLILKFPTKEMVPQHLLSHFMRGMYDGDGCIRLAKGKYLNTTLTSSESFIGSWSAILKNKTIPHQIYRRKDRITAPSLMTSQRSNSKKVCEYLYKDATIYLDRKRDIFNTYLDFLTSRKQNTSNPTIRCNIY